MSERRRLAFIVALALLVRGALLAVRGDYIVYDEGYYLLLARSLRAGHGFALNGLPHVALSPLQPLIVAALSSMGLNDLFASRLLAAACGALLVLPVAFLARQWLGERAALFAALFVALSPGLLTFLPFFPGERWNLYFGSEPLYLLLAMGALAAAWQAARGGPGWWLILAGALVALSYLTRLEGAILGAAVALAVPCALGRRSRGLLPVAAAAVVVGALIAAPYLLYLHRTLGRWAVSGRVQAAAAAAAASGGPSDAVNAFVWGGNREALWSALYALDASGTRMASQYWGVSMTAEERVGISPARERIGALGGAPAPHTATEGDTARRGRRSAAPEGFPPAPRGSPPPARGSPPAPSGTVLRGLSAIAPWWFLLLALSGLALVRPRREALAWIGAAAVAVALPAVLAYVEPRALLLTVPVACLLAAGVAARLGELLARRTSREWARALVPATIALLLAAPTARDLARAWNQDTPLQQLASARRAVGEYLGAHLPNDARIVSWHPAIALYAGREWRVLPYDSFGRIARYAEAQGAAIVVMSRFEPSPLRNPPRAFTAVLLDPASAAPGEEIRLDPVDQTPLLFVGRLARAP